MEDSAMKTRFNHGTALGIEHDEFIHHSGEGTPTTVTCIDYSPTNVTVQEIEKLEDFVGQHRPEWSVVRWISVVGFSNMNVIHTLAKKYDLHPLAVEDVLHG